MDEVISYFQKGRYDKALSNLQSTILYNSVEEGVVFLVDCSVCEGLMCLSNEGDIQKIRTNLQEICEQCLPVGYPSAGVPLKLELTALFNYGWWLLSTTASRLPAAIYRRKWQRFLDMISESCDRILGDLLIQPPQNVISDLLHKLHLVLTIITDKQKTSIGIFLELIIIVLLVIVLINKDSIDSRKQVYHFAKSILRNRKEYETLHTVVSKKSIEDQSIFKFGFLFGNCSVSEIDLEHACNGLAVLTSICTMYLPECELCTDFALSGTSVLQPLLNYVEALKSWHCDELDRSMGLLLEAFDPNCELELAARYHVLLGRLHSRNGNRQKAVDEYKKALDLDKNASVAYYHLGHEYGKMGFPGLMLQHYKKLLKCVRDDRSHLTLPFMLNKRILELCHTHPEINCAEALYVLAVAYGLNEMFDESTTVFQTLLRPPHFGSFIETIISRNKQIISLPNTVTVLHEAAVMNLLTGNLSTCEKLCQQAIDCYPAQERQKCQLYPDAHGSKDTDWIKKLIKLDLEDADDNTPYYEDYVYFFDEDIIGLLLIAQLQKTEEKEEARVTLNQALLILSKQMARIRKEADESKTTESWQPLVKALTCQTCLEIAKFQVNNKPFADVDKMFRRALSCNNGNKDVLFHYAQYLIRANKTHDAQKLVLTFIDKPAVLNVDCCQSLALRYLLQSHVSHRDIQNLVKELGIDR